MKFVILIICVVILAIVIYAPKYRDWGYEMKYLPPSTTDIHELKRSIDEWRLYLLKAKVTQDDFIKFVKDLSAVKYHSTDFIYVWRFQANYPIPEWWDPTNDMSSTFYDPSVNKVSEIRLTKYENGYLYLHYEKW